MGDNITIFLDIIEVQRHVFTDVSIVHGGLFFDNLRTVIFAVAKEKSTQNPFCWQADTQWGADNLGPKKPIISFQFNSIRFFRNMSLRLIAWNETCSSCFY